MNNDIRNIVILGSGAAGYTAAIYTARANLYPLLIDGNLVGGQLTTTTEVENYPGFSKGILGPQLMQEMRSQAERFNTEFLAGTVSSVDLSKNPIEINIDQKKILTKVLIIATGAESKKLGLDNESELMGYGLSTCATCDAAFFRDNTVAVIGGGDSACEESLTLTKFAKKVYLIHRRDELRASKVMVDRVKSNAKIEILWNKNILKLLGKRPEGLNGIVLEDTITKEKTELSCNGVFYAIGHLPNSSIFKPFIKTDKEGYLITTPGRTETEISGVFACGDVQDPYYRQAITAAGSGCMAAIEAERWLAERE